MKLTDENKSIIDNKSYEELLCGIRFSPIGDPWFQGETGEYWGKRMNELRSTPGGDEVHTSISKKIGW